MWIDLLSIGSYNELKLINSKHFENRNKGATFVPHFPDTKNDRY
ncbi:MAG: hypothetical protein RI883_2266 [Bacteroidota bacterium]|jgi:hypothetical protein